MVATPRVNGARRDSPRQRRVPACKVRGDERLRWLSLSWAASFELVSWGMQVVSCNDTPEDAGSNRRYLRLVVRLARENETTVNQRQTTVKMVSWQALVIGKMVFRYE